MSHDWYRPFKFEQQEELKKVILACALPGKSVYTCVNHITVLDIPHTAIQGRAGDGTTFSGHIDLETGKVRIDSNDPAFWLEINLGVLDGIKYAPDGTGTQEAHKEFIDEACESNKKRKIDSEQR